MMPREEAWIEGGFARQGRGRQSFPRQLQSMSAVEFIQQRGKLLQEAEEDIEHKFVDYMVETRVDGARDRDPAGRDVQGGEE
jgi:hypothetical protein